jgi:hypothetical protein
MRKARTHKKRSTRKIKHAKRNSIRRNTKRSRGGSIGDIVVAGTDGVMSKEEFDQMAQSQDQQGLE